MKIVLVDNGGKIPAIKYGGTERVIWGLGKMLSSLNHTVIFLVPEGSYCDFAEVLFYDPLKSLDEQIPQDVDLVHVHFKLKENISKPYLITIHGNYDDEEPFDKQSVFLSKDHAARNNSNVFVYNGLDWDDYPKVNLNLDREHYHFLGKATWKVKNALGAYSIAHKGNLNLKVLGGKKWSEYNLKKGFKYLFNSKIEFLGMVDNDQKMNICSKSKGLIFPVRWHEPFGLAVIESFYCGSPVFATPYGALKELINEDVGFTSFHENELINAVNQANYSPKHCHEYARDLFNSEVMTKNYLKLYEKVLNGELLNSTNPYLIDRNNRGILAYER
ncbi:glycosyltransferase [Nonlabens antarcticus]|uniref:glycosyltransferase n=1 Tax=Nonlabens antarcticus TaxID=392714 RepID=UPI001890DE16|nr:glycosyltransferase [Nonlabens antarcticus]